MKALFERSNRFLDLPIGGGARAALILAAFLLLPVYWLPLWRITAGPPGSGGELRLDIYGHKIEVVRPEPPPDDANALSEDAEPLAPGPSPLNWFPFVVGALALLFLRSAVVGKTAGLLDVIVLYTYFGLFSLWSFGYRAHDSGKSVFPTALVEVSPLPAPLFGSHSVGGVEIRSYPGPGSLVLLAVGLVLAGAMILVWRQGRTSEREDLRMAG